MHEGKTLGGRGREGPHAAALGADEGGEGGVLTFHAEELGLQFPRGAVIREDLHDVGLRRDGVSADHLCLGKPDGLGDGMATFQDPLHRSSSSRVMALRGHYPTQMPHPLQ